MSSRWITCRVWYMCFSPRNRERYWLKSFPKLKPESYHWKDWCWSWNSSTLATSCDKLTYWKRPWCWKGLGAGGEGDNRGGEGDDRGGDGWMASLTRWTWVWVSSGSWWWTGRPGVLWFMGSQRVGHDWVTELNCTEPWCSFGLHHSLFHFFQSVSLWWFSC